LYSKTGDWYHSLNAFPGVLFDKAGFIKFETKEQYEGCIGLKINPLTSKGSGLCNVKKPGISSIHGYTVMSTTLSNEVRVGDIVTCTSGGKKIYCQVNKINKRSYSVDEVELQDSKFVTVCKINTKHKGTLGFSRKIEIYKRREECK